MKLREKKERTIKSTKTSCGITNIRLMSFSKWTAYVNCPLIQLSMFVPSDSRQFEK